jgi:amidase
VDRETDVFVKNQVLNQYDNEMITENKRKLDFSPFLDEMKSMTQERNREILEYVSEKGIMEIQKALSRGSFSHKELVVYFLKRIYKYDKRFNTVMELNPDALKLATEADANRAENLHPLYGIPVLLKDNIATGDKMHNTAGAKVLENFVARKAATIVRHLECVGAIILGKTNMSEWAYYMSSQGICGYSALGGQTKNPYGRYEVGGSSSGSAAALAAGFSVVAIGTETCGSIIYPAGQNSVVGLYPTKGLWSNEGIIPISPSLDTPGPMTLNVEDAAIMLSSLTDDDNIKSINWKETFKKDVKEMVLGLVVNEEIEKFSRSGDDEIIRRLKGELKEAGFIVREITLEEKLNDLKMDEVLEREFKDSLNQYISDNDIEGINGISDILSFYKSNPDSYGPHGFDLIEKASNTKLDKDVVKILEENNRELARKSIDKAFEEVDGLITLSNKLSHVYASAGYPSFAVPAGYRIDGEPVGLTFTTGKMEEEKLLLMGYAYEKATKHRVKPVLEEDNI